MREAVGIYAEALPVSYQRDIASLFRLCVETMAAASIPAALAEDWPIVTQHLANASDTMAQRLAAQTRAAPTQPVEPLDIGDREPVVVCFDRLAALTTSPGARRLETAALAVQDHVSPGAAASLDGQQRRLLRAVASGAAVVDLAAEFGHSPRTTYRELSKLWKALGVPDRTQAIRKAATDGLLD